MPTPPFWFANTIILLFPMIFIINIFYLRFIEVITYIKVIPLFVRKDTKNISNLHTLAGEIFSN